MRLAATDVAVGLGGAPTPAIIMISMEKTGEMEGEEEKNRGGRRKEG
jgi:hypothetical protein